MAAEAEAGGQPLPPIPVEVVWVEADGSIGRCVIGLPAGSCVADALATLRADPRGAGLLERLARGELQAAIFGERCEPGAQLAAGDRIELVAGLSVDPKVARRRRVQKRRALEPRSKWRGD
jgi:putative ubiquitin-RnfH superfamily antitoxin RatB of RatAB toxin-antitoxin module